MHKHVFWALSLACALVVACGDEVRVSDDDDGHGGQGQGGAGGSTVIPPTSDKLDLLLVVDNSRGMADKQAVLAQAVPDLVQRLVNPRCVDAAGNPSAQQPADPLAACPEAGTVREMQPLLDIHIGLVSSSLGGHGADSCTAINAASENDAAHLLSRVSTDPGAPSVPTWDNKSFLAWDPTGETHIPPGEANLDSLIQNTAQLVVGVGAVGCGFEAPLEAWYRFLIEPDPFESIILENNNAVLEGTDAVLLAQRRDFLRPDSMLAIVLLTDENDCSIRDGGQFYFAAQVYVPGAGGQQYHLPKPRAACATDPNSPCCRSCGQAPGEGCDQSADDCTGSLSEYEDDINLRCWDQKRRFGIDFLHPTERYVDGLTLSQVTDRHGSLVQNPLYQDLNPNDDNTTVRDPSLVLLAGVVGVPWQDIARRDGNGNPDLVAGLDAHGNPVGGVQSGEELIANGTWSLILGDPSCYTSNPGACRPTDAHMIEDWSFRPGLPGPGSADPMHGHERTIAQDDLQYACIFPLPVPYDCSVTAFCLCDPGNDSPLCENPVGSNTFGTMQYAAAAVPGLRPLSVLKGMGAQGVVGSICPAQLDDPTRSDYGYRPSVGGIIDRLKLTFGG